MLPAAQGIMRSRHGEQRRVAREESNHALQGMVGVPGILLFGLLLGHWRKFPEVGFINVESGLTNLI